MIRRPSRGRHGDLPVTGPAGSGRADTLFALGYEARDLTGQGMTVTRIRQFLDDAEAAAGDLGTTIAETAPQLDLDKSAQVRRIWVRLSSRRGGG